MEYLNQHWLTSNTIFGATHFVTAIVGLILGLGILFLQPGSKTHKIAGYIFIPVLLFVNISALFIHEMGMRFGPFHYIIPVSLFYLFLGLKPFMFKTIGEARLKTHIKGMVGAALGLWAAFFAELVARTPSINKALLSIGGDSFWILTIEGFIFVIIFMVIIRAVRNRQYKRLNLINK